MSDDFLNVKLQRCLETILERTPVLDPKSRASETATLLVAAALCVAGPHVFRAHFAECMHLLVVRVRERTFSAEALRAVARLLWTYYYKYAEAWATLLERTETLCALLFPAERKSVVGCEEDVGGAVEVLDIIGHKQPRFVLNEVIKRLAKQATGHMTQSLDQMPFDRMTIALRSFLLLVAGIHAGERPAFPGATRTVVRGWDDAHLAVKIGDLEVRPVYDELCELIRMAVDRIGTQHWNANANAVVYDLNRTKMLRFLETAFTLYPASIELDVFLRHFSVNHAGLRSVAMGAVSRRLESSSLRDKIAILERRLVHLISHLVFQQLSLFVEHEAVFHEEWCMVSADMRRLCEGVERETGVECVSCGETSHADVSSPHHASDPASHHGYEDMRSSLRVFFFFCRAFLQCEASSLLIRKYESSLALSLESSLALSLESSLESSLEFSLNPTLEATVVLQGAIGCVLDSITMWSTCRVNDLSGRLSGEDVNHLGRVVDVYFMVLAAHEGLVKTVYLERQGSRNILLRSWSSLVGFKRNAKETADFLVSLLEHADEHVRLRMIASFRHLPIHRVAEFMRKFERLRQTVSDDLVHLRYVASRKTRRHERLKVEMTRLYGNILTTVADDCDTEKHSFAPVRMILRHVVELFYFLLKVECDAFILELRSEFLQLLMAYLRIVNSVPETLQTTLLPHRFRRELWNTLMGWHRLHRPLAVFEAIPPVTRVEDVVAANTCASASAGTLATVQFSREDEADASERSIARHGQNSQQMLIAQTMAHLGHSVLRVSGDDQGDKSSGVDVETVLAWISVLLQGVRSSALDRIIIDTVAGLLRTAKQDACDRLLEHFVDAIYEAREDRQNWQGDLFLCAIVAAAEGERGKFDAVLLTVLLLARGDLRGPSAQQTLQMLHPNVAFPGELANSNGDEQVILSETLVASQLDPIVMVDELVRRIKQTRLPAIQRRLLHALHPWIRQLKFPATGSEETWRILCMLFRLTWELMDVFPHSMDALWQALVLSHQGGDNLGVVIHYIVLLLQGEASDRNVKTACFVVRALDRVKRRRLIRTVLAYAHMYSGCQGASRQRILEVAGAGVDGMMNGFTGAGSTSTAGSLMPVQVALLLLSGLSIELDMVEASVRGSLRFLQTLLSELLPNTSHLSVGASTESDLVEEESVDLYCCELLLWATQCPLQRVAAAAWKLLRRHSARISDPLIETLLLVTKRFLQHLVCPGSLRYFDPPLVVDILHLQLTIVAENERVSAQSMARIFFDAGAHLQSLDGSVFAKAVELLAVCLEFEEIWELRAEEMETMELATCRQMHQLLLSGVFRERGCIALLHLLLTTEMHRGHFDGEDGSIFGLLLPRFFCYLVALLPSLFCFFDCHLAMGRVDAPVSASEAVMDHANFLAYLNLLIMALERVERTAQLGELNEEERLCFMELRELLVSVERRRSRPAVDFYKSLARLLMDRSLREHAADGLFVLLVNWTRGEEEGDICMPHCFVLFVVETLCRDKTPLSVKMHETGRRVAGQLASSLAQMSFVENDAVLLGETLEFLAQWHDGGK